MLNSDSLWVCDEVQLMGNGREYAVSLAQKKGISVELTMLKVATLPVVVIERTDYESTFSEADVRIGRRDKDDVDLLALALQREIPIWTNDKDFEGCGVLTYTTAKLLTLLLD